MTSSGPGRCRPGRGSDRAGRSWRRATPHRHVRVQPQGVGPRREPDRAGPGGRVGRVRDEPPGTADPFGPDGGVDHVGETQKAGDELGGRVLPDVLRGADLLDAPGSHDHDAVGEREGLVLVVRDEERSDREGDEQRAELSDQPFAQLPVE